MPYTARAYAGGVVPGTLISDLDASTTSTAIAVTSTTGWDALISANATKPCVIALDYGLTSEEKVLATAGSISRAGSTVSISSMSRAYDGSSAQSHQAATAGAVLPVAAAIDFSDASDAVANTVAKVTSTGDLLVGTGSGTLGRLGVGSARSILIGGTSPAWVEASAANLVPITDGSTISWQPGVYGNPSAKIYPTAATSVTNSATFPGTGTGTQIGNMTSEYVNGGMTVASNQITVPTSGYYSINCLITWQSFASGGAVTNLVKTASGVDSLIAQWMGYSNGSGQTPAIGGAVTVFLAAGNKIALGCKQNNGNTQSTNFGSTLTWLAATLVSI